MAHSGQADPGVPPSFFPGFQLPIQSILEANEFACSNCKYLNFRVATSSLKDFRTEHPTTHILVLMTQGFEDIRKLYS